MAKKQKKKSTRKATSTPLHKATARENGKLGGRPRTEADWSDREWQMFEWLIMVGAHEHNIASILNVKASTVDDIVRRKYGVGFRSFRAQKRKDLKRLLFAKQLEKALEGDNQMLIWLGKQLGQTDKHHLKEEIDATVTHRAKRVVIYPDNGRERE